MRKWLPRIGASIQFCSPRQIQIPSLDSVTIQQGRLDTQVFAVQHTTGVQGDIQRAGQESGGVHHVFSAASQFNAGESPDRSTVPPNQACSVYASDYTQGPQAQLAYPSAQVELINCASNIGFNGLVSILNENARAEMAHGYFTAHKNLRKCMQIAFFS